jgi:uncharacterized protein (DUF736 family)
MTGIGYVTRNENGGYKGQLKTGTTERAKVCQS